jgi:hypothetical protein
MISFAPEETRDTVTASSEAFMVDSPSGSLSRVRPTGNSPQRTPPKKPPPGL